jgi:hypothetical protein
LFYPRFWCPNLSALGTRHLGERNVLATAGEVAA